MKKIIISILLIMFSLIIVGCDSEIENSKDNKSIPNNTKLAISGVWYSNKYSILDKNVASSDEIKEIQESNLTFDMNTVEIGNKRYEGVNYTLKLVKSDYVISYEAKYTIEDLGLEDEDVTVYSISYDNNLIGELINVSKEESYFYYKGILFSVTREGDIPDNSEDDKEVISEDNSDETNKVEMSQGVYIGLKVEGKEDKEGNYIREEYRTLWISTDKGKLQSIKQRENIIFPRSGGIWKLIPQTYEIKSKNIYYEYFDAMPIEKEEKTNPNIKNEKVFSQGKNVKRSINFVGNDYLATEVKINEKFSESPAYQVLPIDNLLTNSGISIGDIFGIESNRIYKENYQSTYENIDSEVKEKLSRYINYSNYTLVRNNGKWILQGMISPVLSDGKAYVYSLNIKSTKPLVKYDTLIIPWKVLKGNIPMITDVFISPKGSLALILTDKKLEVYKIIGGKLDKQPIKVISLKDGEKVIMSEWCEGDYVDKWSTAFKENSSIIE